MRSIWKGSISFGLVNIPVRLYTATQQNDVRFNSLHQECLTRIRYQKYCPSCDREVGQEEIVKGYPLDGQRYVVVEEEDFEGLPVATSHQVQIVDFVELREIDPVYFDKTYYLEPNEGAQKPYSLLRRAMADTEMVALAKAAIRHKESLACVRVYSDVLVMETMFYPDEIRSTEGLTGIDADTPLEDAELDMAVRLIQNLSHPFDPDKYHDEYREALLKLIQSKVDGDKQVQPSPAPAANNVVNLMEALEASLKATSKEDKPKRRAPKTARQTATRKRKETGTS